MMPMPYRLLTSLAVRLNGRIYLFDAGEGTQVGIKKARLGVRGLGLIAISHLHGDHCLGLMGLMMLKSQMEDPGPLSILGPPGIGEFVTHNQKILEFRANYSIHFAEWSEESSEKAYQDDQVRIFWHPLKHTRFCLGYRIEELERPGKFDPNRAEQLGIPKGPSWGKLQRGENVISENGGEITPEQVMGPPRRGRHVAYVVDTRPARGVYRLCKNADIAFMEGMFLPEDAEHADAKGHMTVVDAARIADRAGVARAVLVHISPRYDNEQLALLETAARERFEHAEIGRESEIYQVPFAD